LLAALAAMIAREALPPRGWRSGFLFKKTRRLDDPRAGFQQRPDARNHRLAVRAAAGNQEVSARSFLKLGSVMMPPALLLAIAGLLVTGESA
jgi:hypothetical protein